MKKPEFNFRRPCLPKCEYFDEIPGKIWQLLLFRFCAATLLSLFLNMFILFCLRCHSYQLGELEGTFVSTLLLIIVQPGVAAYGLLLCHIHNKPPVCYQTRLQRMRMEMQLRLLLLGTLLYVSVFTNWMYARHIPGIYGDGTPGYVLIHGCFSGIAHFLDEHGRCLRRFSSSGKDGLYIWQSIIRSMCTSHKVRLIVLTTLLSGRFQACCCVLVQNGDFGQGRSAAKMFWALVLATLVQTTLHIIMNVYEMVMQLKLPLVLVARLHLGHNAKLWDPIVLWIYRQNLWPIPERICDLQLSYHMALDTKCLHGFRLLAASEFHVAAASNKNYLCSDIFSSTLIHNQSWQELRDVITGMVTEFVTNMKNAMKDTESPVRPLQTCPKNIAPKETMRNLSTTPPNLRLRVGNMSAPLGQPRQQNVQKCVPIRARGIWEDLSQTLYVYCRQILQCLFRNLSIISLGIWESVPVLPVCVHYFCDTDPMAKINHTLRQAEHLDDVLRGLVRICVRSLTEDKYGLIQPDLLQFLKALLLLESQLCEAKNMMIARKGRLCGTHRKLLVGIKHCLFCMLQHFSPYLDFIVDGDENMLKTLKCWKERLGMTNTFHKSAQKHTSTPLYAHH